MDGTSKSQAAHAREFFLAEFPHIRPDALPLLRFVTKDRDNPFALG